MQSSTISDGNSVIYSTPERRQKTVWLLYSKRHPDDENGHFDCIRNVAGFLKKRKFCNYCKKAYNSPNHHHCDATCLVCKSSDCFVREERPQIMCHECNMQCRSQACYNRHKTDIRHTSGKRAGLIKTPASCGIFWKCLTCKHVVNKTKRAITEHKCGEFKCRLCNNYFVTEHFCHSRQKILQDTSGKHIDYDFECMQNTGEHVPNYCYAMSASISNAHQSLCVLAVVVDVMYVVSETQRVRSTNEVFVMAVVSVKRNSARFL